MNKNQTKSSSASALKSTKVYFSSGAEPKHVKITTQKGKEDSFILLASSHPTAHWHCSAPRGNSQLKRVLPGKGRVAWKSSFPSPSVHYTVSTSVSTMPETDKAEMHKDSKEQELKARTTSRSHSGSNCGSQWPAL